MACRITPKSGAEGEGEARGRALLVDCCFPSPPLQLLGSVGGVHCSLILVLYLLWISPSPLAVAARRECGPLFPPSRAGRAGTSGGSTMQTSARGCRERLGQVKVRVSSGPPLPGVLLLSTQHIASFLI